MRDNSLTRVLTANRPDVLAPPRGKQVAALRQGTHSPSAYRKIACSLFLFLAVIYGEPAFSCSLAFRLPVEPTPGEHVFIGTVVGYADPIEAPNEGPGYDVMPDGVHDWVTGLTLNGCAVHVHAQMSNERVQASFSLVGDG